MATKPGLFEDITLKWGETDRDGNQPEYKIPSNKVMMAIGVIEEHVTLAELGVAISQRRVPLSRLSAAWAALLQFAGANVTQEEVYVELFQKTNSGLSVQAASSVVTGLLMIMMPPSTIKKPGAEEAPGTEGKRRRRRAKAA